MKFISQVKNLKGKVVLLRADLNSDFSNGKLLMGERIKQAAETIKLLKRKKARVVIIAHQGQKGKEDFVSLRQHSKYLSKLTKVKFVGDLVGESALSAIRDLNNGEALLLENLRFIDDETNPGKNNLLIEKLVPLCDIYVNDAFSVSHRDHTSIVLFPKYLKKYAGPLLEKELKALKKIHLGKTLYILGGAKSKDYLDLLTGKNKTLACGLFGQSCLVARGQNLGAQNKYLEKEADLNLDLKKELRKRLKNIVTPVDFGVRISGKRKNLDLGDFPSNYVIYDIGPKTIKIFLAEIKKAKAIYMKGPAGDFASKGFEDGTYEILRAISKSKAFSLIGGGHLIDALYDSGLKEKNFGHVSLSGGALLKVVAGEKLPGVEVLK